MTRYLKLLSLSFLAFCVPMTAQAKKCEHKAEEIFVLKEPVFNGRKIWTLKHGGTGTEQINDVAIAHDDGGTFTENTYVIIGDYTDNEEDQTPRPFIAEVNRKGKILWETKSEGKLEKTATHLAKTEDGYAVMGSIKNSKNWRGIYIERYNKTGKLLSRTPVYGDEHHVDGKGMTLSLDKKGFVIAAKHVAVREGDVDEAVLYRIDEDGALAWRRRYNTGLNMMFNNVQTLPNDFYAVTGNVDHVKTGQTMGLLMQLNEKGTKGWQQNYPRGDMTTLKKVITTADDSFIAIGGTVPKGNTKESAMVIKTTPNGSMVWRRYFVGDYRFVVQDVARVNNDRIVVLIDAYPQGPEDPLKPSKGHIQVVTLSTRGDLLGVESYSSGQSAHAGRFVEGDKLEHIIVGTVQAKDPEFTPPNELPPPQFDGWLIGAQLKNESFQDLCDKSK